MKSSPNEGERKENMEFNLMFNYTVAEEVRSPTLLSKEHRREKKICDA